MRAQNARCLRAERQAEKVREERAVSWTRPQHGLASFPRFPQPGVLSSRVPSLGEAAASNQAEVSLPRNLRVPTASLHQPELARPLRGPLPPRQTPRGLSSLLRPSCPRPWGTGPSLTRGSALCPLLGPHPHLPLQHQPQRRSQPWASRAPGRGSVCGVRAALCCGAFHGSCLPRVQSAGNTESGHCWESERQCCLMSGPMLFCW